MSNSLTVLLMRVTRSRGMRKFCRPITDSGLGIGERVSVISEGVETGREKTGMRGWSGSIVFNGTVLGLSAMVGIPSTGSSIPSEWNKRFWNSTDRLGSCPAKNWKRNRRSSAIAKGVNSAKERMPWDCTWWLWVMTCSNQGQLKAWPNSVHSSANTLNRSPNKSGLALGTKTFSTLSKQASNSRLKAVLIKSLTSPIFMTSSAWQVQVVKNSARATVMSRGGPSPWSTWPVMAKSIRFCTSSVAKLKSPKAVAVSDPCPFSKASNRSSMPWQSCCNVGKAAIPAPPLREWAARLKSL